MVLSTEHLTTPERITFTPLLGLQGRLEMGGAALNPNNTVNLKTGIDQQVLPSTTELISKASVRERNDYWKTQHPELTTKDAQLTAWKKSVTKMITALPSSPLGTEHGDFFAKMGIDISHFDEGNVQELYDTYFGNDTGGNGAELFMGKVFETFNSPDGFDLDAVKKHMPALEWMAGIFGGNSSELIAQLIDAHTDFLSVENEKAFIDKRAAAVNSLSSHERDLLTFLTDESKTALDENSQSRPTDLTAKPAQASHSPQQKPTNTPGISDVSELVSTPFEVPHVSYQENLQAAQTFCTKLRQRMSNNTKPIGRDQIVYRDPQTEISVQLPKTEDIMRSGMYAHQFVQWVDKDPKNSFPVALLTTNLIPGVAHANLLLSGPKLGTDGQYHVDYYDPYSAQESSAVLNGLQPFETFKAEHMKQIKEKGNTYEIKQTPTQGKPYTITIDKSYLNQYLVDTWLNLHTSTRGKFYAPSISKDAADALIKGTYDLTLGSDTELPAEMKHGKMGQLQFTESDCAPLSFYAGMLRYLAKPGEQLKKIRLARKIKQDWDVSILTRNELIGLKDADPRVNELYKKQFAFTGDPQPFTVVDAYTNASGNKIIVLYRKEDDRAKEISFEELTVPPLTQENGKKLTPEFAEHDPASFVKELLDSVKNNYPQLYQAWEFAEKKGLISLNRLKIDPNTWMSESDARDGITLGTQPMSKGEKYRIIFDDEKFDYPAEVTYRLSHELSHKLLYHVANQLGQESEFNSLLKTLVDLNTAKGKVLTALASQQYYKQSGPETQGTEDMTELISMYLQSPDYLKQYLNFLADDSYRNMRQQYGLVDLEGDTAEALFDSIQRGMQPLFQEMEAK